MNPRRPSPLISLVLSLGLSSSTSWADDSTNAEPTPELSPVLSTPGLVIDQKSLRQLALLTPTMRGGTSRSFDGLLRFAPNTQDEAHGVSINGASAFENRYELDGLSLGDPVLGVNAFPLSVEFLEHLALHTGGGLPEPGNALGGTIQVSSVGIPYLRYHGSLFATWTPGWVQAASRPASGPTWTLTGQNKIRQQADAGFTFSGPFWPKTGNTLYFFAGLLLAGRQVEHTRALHSGPEQPISGIQRRLFANELALQTMEKLMYEPVLGQSLSLMFLTTLTHSGGGGLLPFEPGTGRAPDFLNASPEALPTGVLDHNASLAALSYRGEFWAHLLTVEAHLGWTHQTRSRRPDGDLGLERLTDVERRPVTEFEPGAAVESACGEDSAQRLARCPVQFYETGGRGPAVQHTLERYQANAQLLQKLEFNGEPMLSVGLNAERVSHLREETATRLQRSRTASELLGGFAWWKAVFKHRLKFKAGLRYDTQWLNAVDEGQRFWLGQQLSPTLGLDVDPWMDRRMKLFAHAARYTGQVPLGVLEAVTGGTRVDPQSAPPASHELLTGAEYALVEDFRVLATYTHRAQDSVLAPLSVDEDPSFFLGTPGVGLGHGLPRAERTLDAVTVALSSTPSFNAWKWWLQASYTWSRLYGNYEGPFRMNPGWGGPDLEPTRALRSTGGELSGLLPSDRTHTVRLQGTRRFDLAREEYIYLGASYLGRSGAPIEYLGGHPRLGMGETFVLPRGSSGERTPWVHELNAHLGVHHQTRFGEHITVTLDVFNLFNFQTATRVNEHYTYAHVLPLGTRLAPVALTPEQVSTAAGTLLDASQLNPEFRKPIQHQTPREVRLSVRYGSF